MSEIYRSYREAFYSERQYVSDKYEHYFDIYDEVMIPFYQKDVNYLEIGVQNGGGLEIARKLFGPGSKIFGVDVDRRCAVHTERGLADRMVIGTQAGPETLKLTKSLAPHFDIILDDGSHRQHDIISTFIDLFPKISNNGVYIIEDTHSIYDHSINDGFYGISAYDYFCALARRLPIEFADPKKRGTKFRSEPSTRSDEKRDYLARTIHSVMFYDSIIVIKKRFKDPIFRISRPDVKGANLGTREI